MDCVKIGELIKKLRLEQNLTQRQLADKMALSDKTISKWERGCGLPDISLLHELSNIFNTNIEKLLSGEIPTNKFVEGNMKKSKYYVCPECNNISICTGEADIYCCGRRLEYSEPKKAQDNDKLSVETIENEWYISSSHPMAKDDYITFLAFATGDKIQLIKLYPEWDLSVRIAKREHGTLLWFSEKTGLLYQLL